MGKQIQHVYRSFKTNKQSTITDTVTEYMFHLDKTLDICDMSSTLNCATCLFVLPWKYVYLDKILWFFPAAPVYFVGFPKEQFLFFDPQKKRKFYQIFLRMHYD